ncbi:hypothetical protein QUF74_14895 [Candidatus Halobeggiatoa sp. HSG11]|nr:hypothetical protein [Candidatus Halobeggiatoa sp. HSG11]
MRYLFCITIFFTNLVFAQESILVEANGTFKYVPRSSYMGISVKNGNSEGKLSQPNGQINFKWEFSENKDGSEPFHTIDESHGSLDFRKHGKESGIYYANLTVTTHKDKLSNSTEPKKICIGQEFYEKYCKEKTDGNPDEDDNSDGTDDSKSNSGKLDEKDVSASENCNIIAQVLRFREFESGKTIEWNKRNNEALEMELYTNEDCPEKYFVAVQDQYDSSTRQHVSKGSPYFFKKTGTFEAIIVELVDGDYKESFEPAKRRTIEIEEICLEDLPDKIAITGTVTLPIKTCTPTRVPVDNIKLEKIELITSYENECKIEPTLSNEPDYSKISLIFNKKLDTGICVFGLDISVIDYNRFKVSKQMIVTLGPPTLETKIIQEIDDNDNNSFILENLKSDIEKWSWFLTEPRYSVVENDKCLKEKIMISRDSYTIQIPPELLALYSAVEVISSSDGKIQDKIQIKHGMQNELNLILFKKDNTENKCVNIGLNYDTYIPYADYFKKDAMRMYLAINYGLLEKHDNCQLVVKILYKPDVDFVTMLMPEKNIFPLLDTNDIKPFVFDESVEKGDIFMIGQLIDYLENTDEILQDLVYKFEFTISLFDEVQQNVHCQLGGKDIERKFNITVIE